VRAFLVGLVMMTAVVVIVLSIRPGGLRRQLRLAARRLRLVLVLGGVYLAVSTLIRIFITSGPIADFGPPVLALVLAAVFVVLAQDPVAPQPPKP
jgi:hypothetical protein